MSLTSLLEEFHKVRRQTVEICHNLSVEEHVVQPADFVSPPKWHLAHTTWFFENFILKEFAPKQKSYNPHFDILFNSYYKSQGVHWQQSHRGHQSLPTVSDTYEYRSVVDGIMERCLKEDMNVETSEKLQKLTEIGIQHEQQHQELLHMDILYIRSQNPQHTSNILEPRKSQPHIMESFIPLKGGLIEVGRNESPNAFCFDNETPRHRYFLEDFSLQNRPVTHGDFLHFIEDGGYTSPLLWKSDGWDRRQSKDASHTPLYWIHRDGQHLSVQGDGTRPMDMNAPVAHLDFYEADAFATWSGARLPTEQELEYVYGHLEDFQCRNTNGMYLESGSLPFYSLRGNLWEWTRSSYDPYPRYKKPPGAFGEYNQKFMINQKVLRGGSFSTPTGHFRNTYRNFFHPHQSWAFTGVRLARDSDG